MAPGDCWGCWLFMSRYFYCSCGHLAGCIRLGRTDAYLRDSK
jgi:hypothetical protein